MFDVVFTAILPSVSRAASPALRDGKNAPGSYPFPARHPFYPRPLGAHHDLHIRLSPGRAHHDDKKKTSRDASFGNPLRVSARRPCRALPCLCAAMGLVPVVVSYVCGAQPLISHRAGIRLLSTARATFFNYLRCRPKCLLAALCWSWSCCRCS
jgi:hypothetical protein